MGKTIWILVLAAMLAAGAAAPPPPTPVAQALAALDRGDPQQAQSLSDSGLKDETVDVRTRARLLLYHGLAAALLGARDTAMQDLTKAIDSSALPPDEREQAYLQRGFLRESLGQMDDAIGDYSTVIASKSYSMATAFNRRGDIYLGRGSLADARQDYLAALTADGGQSQYAYYGLGRVAESEGDKLAARGFYAKAVAVDAGYAAASERLSALAGAQHLVLGPPTKSGGPADSHPLSGTQQNRAAALPAVPPLSGLMPVTTLRPALDQPDDRLWPVDEVQLGAWRSKAEADAAWHKLKASAAGLLDGSTPQILAADLPGKGRYFRLRVRSGESAARMCIRLAAKALDCFPVRD
ncbi:MAG TPA: tetratricopeptide repeat protein [Rhizomicrobium sp.]|jgi:tetratricopeptide (TPR) repeat protein|nr:tetratricopeptide repeat protein [Rhizomicrobium sp.]